MGLSVDDNTAKDILAKAFLEAVPREYQDRLLMEGVKFVFTEREKYGEKTNMLDKLFREVVCSYARERVDALVKNDPEIAAKMEEITKAVMLQALDQFKATICDHFKAVLEASLKNRW